MPSGLYRFFGSFQSTHPSRGATLLHLSDGNSDAVSIHAPLAGCDDWIMRRIKEVAGFQSTHPSRGATRPIDPFPWTLRFQSTHPSRGAICTIMDHYPPVLVSIHAPLAGCDPRCLCPQPSSFCFNPRTPRGVRLFSGRSFLPSRRFNPRTPRGVRRRGAGNEPQYRGVSIHAPLAGCDLSSRYAGCGGLVSIHAPLAGCDDAPSKRTRCTRRFNPRTPRGVRLSS